MKTTDIKSESQRTEAGSSCTLQHYRPLTGRFDECKLPSGEVRPAWNAIEAFLNRVGPDGLAERSTTIEQLLRENGTTFSINADDQKGPGKETSRNRPWQISTMPLVIESDSWTQVETGLAQRVRLLESVLGDLLGPQRLIKQGIIPAELLGNNPLFERAYHGLPNSGGIRLNVTATDLARGTNGTWWVTGDRTRAPSGLGYLLENRVITSRVFPKLIRQCNTRRLASFFESLRDNLRSMALRTSENPRVALLTPGADSYREFEDEYLARYLGFALVQGTDLAVRGGRLHLKTLGGLLPIEVLWRHVSDRKCDPLELDASSIEGAIGLLRAVRGENLAVANSIGSVLAQSPAMIPFLNRACRFFFGEDLQLPSVATYWCGGASEREHVLRNLDNLLIRPAFAITAAPATVTSDLTASGKAELIAAIKASPQQYVAQERIELSTTPVWDGESLKPWSVTLRCFHLQNHDGVQTLPGALARVSPEQRLLGPSPSTGKLAQDCWICSDAPVDHETTLLPQNEQVISLKRSGDELPSRVAEHLYWLGRYAERAETIARLLRTTLSRLASEYDVEDLPELPSLIAALAAIGQIEPDYAVEPLSSAMPKFDTVLPASVLITGQPRGLQATVESVLRNATAVRDRLSIDAFRIVRRAADDLNAPMNGQNAGRLIERLNKLIADLLSFAGVMSESFTRTHAWQFLELGRRIERADQTSELLFAMIAESGSKDTSTCEAVLEMSDSLMTYRSRYLNIVRVAPVVDLLVTDETNPRSVRYQLEEISRVIRQLPSESRLVGLGPDEKLAIEMTHALRMADPNHLATIDSKGRRSNLTNLLQLMVDDLPRLSDAIAAKYLIHTATPQIITGSLSHKSDKRD